MLNSFLPQHSPDLAHPLFPSIVDLLEFVLLLIESFEVVVLRHNDLAGMVEMASRVSDMPFHCFHGVFAPSLTPAVSSRLSFSCTPVCHSLTVPLSPLLVRGNSRRPPFPFSVLAIGIETMLPASDFVMSPCGTSLAMLSWGPVLSWVCFHFLSPVVVVGHTWFPRSPGELWVPA